MTAGQYLNDISRVFKAQRLGRAFVNDKPTLDWIQKSEAEK